ncbi:hypothetical protein QW180_07115 [Vibrio sinaloensis]|nr:hypothetical protein [Vibrio sinaloensis]
MDDSKIRIDSANKHKAPLGIFDMVKSGQYDLGHSSSYYWKGKVPNTLYFSSMPFGMISTEQYAWFYRGGRYGAHGESLRAAQLAVLPRRQFRYSNGRLV